LGKLQSHPVINKNSHTMKHIHLFLPLFLFSLAAKAQVPDSFTYQLVIRDVVGEVVKNDTVSIEVSIVSDSAMGQSQYSEVHSATTTVSGLVTLVIGTGSNQTGNLSAISWESAPYFLKIRTDIEGGTNYGTAISMEMVSVPYALYSGQADTALDAAYADTLAVRVSQEGDTLFLGTAGKYVVIPGLSEANNSPPPANGSCLSARDTTVVVTVTSTTGQVWMDRNLGADRVALSSVDSLSLGDLYQWGRSSDGHQCRNSDTTSTKASTSTASADQAWAGKFILGYPDWLSTPDTTMWQGVDGVNNPCPTGFRIPTVSEWDAEGDAWGTVGNFTEHAYNSPLRLPQTGGRYYSLKPGIAQNGWYWSSTVVGTKAIAFYFDVIGDYTSPSGSNRSTGYAVRCIKD
jgi:hypothetical protein